MNSRHLNVSTLLVAFLIIGSIKAQSQTPPSTSVEVPFQLALSTHIAPGSTVAFQFYEVPAGKQLIIDFVSAWADVGVGEQAYMIIQTSVRGAVVDYRLSHSSVDNGNFTQQLVANQLLRICADGGTRVVVQLFRVRTGTLGTMLFALSGRLHAI